MSGISYNVHGTTANLDKNKLLNHVTKINPRWILVMDSLSLCREIKAVSPATNVIHRTWPDEEFYKTESPLSWVNRKRAEIGSTDAWCYTVNEMGFGDNLIQWWIDAIKYAVPLKMKIVVGNMSVGTPEAHEWQKPKALELLRLLDKHREYVVLGLHEYACGVVTSGFLGGYPDNAGVAPTPDNAGKGQNLIPPLSWPFRGVVDKITRFHNGRFKFMVEACQKNNIPLPRVVITEHGYDDLGDLKQWSMSLPKTPPYTTIRGWKSLVECWLRWYSQLGWSAQRALYEQLAYADKVLYQNSCVEGQLIFCWGQSTNQWDQFDVSGANTFQELLEANAGTTPPVPPVEPPDEIPTEPIPIPKVVTLNDVINLLKKHWHEIGE